MNDNIDIEGGIMYIAAFKKGKRRIYERPYCTICSRIIAMTKIKEVVHYAGDKFISYDPIEENRLAIENNIKKKNEISKDTEK